MGIYHLMGLGLYIGAVTSPLVYVAERARRKNEEDQHFLKRGVTARTLNSDSKIRGLVLFTTPDMYWNGRSGNKPMAGYKLHRDGVERIIPEGLPAPELLKNALGDLRDEIADILPENRELPVWWCLVPMKDAHKTLERISQTVNVMAYADDQGDQTWACINGGMGVISISLQTSIGLSSIPARQYFRFQENPASLCCPENEQESFWMDLPPMSLLLGNKNSWLRLRDPILEASKKDGLSLVSGYKPKLISFLVGHFNMSELNSLCCDMEISHESIKGWNETLEVFAREIVSHYERRNDISRLILAARAKRAHVDWDNALILDKSLEWMVMERMEQEGEKGISAIDLWHQLKVFVNKKYTQKEFENGLIKPLVARGYMLQNDKVLRKGPEWQRACDYFDALDKAQSGSGQTLDELAAKQESWPDSERWFYKQVINL